MKLPNAEKAVIEPRKLMDYCLNPFHEVGKHKALIFQKALGLTAANADFLIDSIFDAISKKPALIYGETDFGYLYRVEFELTFEGRTARVRTGWIVRFDENFPRLTTCFIV